MVKRNTRTKYVLSKDLRYGTRAQRKALLRWINLPKYRTQKPTPAELVTACKRGGPLFGLMTTNKDQAAQNYWRQTAQDIIRHINVVRVDVRTNKVLTEPIVAHIAVKRGQYGRIGEDDYVPAQRIADDPQLRGSVLDNAYNDLLAWKRRYERCAEFMDNNHVIAAYTKLERELAAARRKNTKAQKAA